MKGVFLVAAIIVPVLCSAELDDAVVANLCQTTFGRSYLGSRCDPFVPLCQVSEWTPWKPSPTDMGYAASCPKKYLAVEERTREIVSAGRNCPPQRETRTLTDCLSDVMVDAVSSIQLSQAIGDDVNPAAGGGLPFRNAQTQDALDQIEMLYSPSRRRKRETCNCPCSQGVSQLQRDLVIVVDSSSSINPNNFDSVVSSLVKLITHLCHFSSSCIGNDLTRLALVSFASRVEVVVDFNAFEQNYRNMTLLEGLIRSLPHIRSSTATGKALQVVRDRILKVDAGMRVNSLKTIIVLTDGQSNKDPEPGPIADTIAQAHPGIKIIALGIGSAVNIDELQSITGHTNDRNILIDGFQNFNDVIDLVILAAQTVGCQSVRDGGDAFNKRR